MNRLANLEELLKSSGKSITASRKMVFEVFSKHDALSMKQLIEAVSGSMNRASVYRVVDLFVELGVLNRIQIGWKYKLELSEQFSDHHHHISCKKCHKVEILKHEDALEGHIKTIAKNANYELTGHTLDLVGLCKDCK